MVDIPSAEELAEESHDNLGVTLDDLDDGSDSDPVETSTDDSDETVVSTAPISTTDQTGADIPGTEELAEDPEDQGLPGRNDPDYEPSTSDEDPDAGSDVVNYFDDDAPEDADGPADPFANLEGYDDGGSSSTTTTPTTDTEEPVNRPVVTAPEPEPDPNGGQSAGQALRTIVVPGQSGGGGNRSMLVLVLAGVAAVAAFAGGGS